MRARRVLIALAVMVVALGLAPDAQAATQPPPRQPKVVVHWTARDDTAKTTRAAYSRAAGCRRVTITATGYTLLGSHAFRYYVHNAWCWHGGVITAWSRPTATYWVAWGFSYNGSDPPTASWYRFLVVPYRVSNRGGLVTQLKGHFTGDVCYPWPVAYCPHYNPWVRFRAHGDGTYAQVHAGG